MNKGLLMCTHINGVLNAVRFDQWCSRGARLQPLARLPERVAPPGRLVLIQCADSFTVSGLSAERRAVSKDLRGRAT